MSRAKAFQARPRKQKLEVRSRNGAWGEPTTADTFKCVSFEMLAHETPAAHVEAPPALIVLDDAVVASMQAQEHVMTGRIAIAATIDATVARPRRPSPTSPRTQSARASAPASAKRPREANVVAHIAEVSP